MRRICSTPICPKPGYWPENAQAATQQAGSIHIDEWGAGIRGLTIRQTRKPAASAIVRQHKSDTASAAAVSSGACSGWDMNRGRPSGGLVEMRASRACRAAADMVVKVESALLRVP